MKTDVFYEKLTKESEFSINFLEVEVPCLDVPWHYHPETEIIFTAYPFRSSKNR